MEKSFLITVDTEGDNQWNWHPGEAITTHNARFVPRFQTLCESYGFIPVYLTNYEMAMDEAFAAFLREKAAQGLCEVGMHLHAWYNPPEYDLPNGGGGGQPYLIEYPPEIMRQKIVGLTDLLEEKIGIRPVTHRAGRWAMNSTYFDLLMECGYIADCSVTPGVDLSNLPGYTAGSEGSNYRWAHKGHYRVQHSARNVSLLELPMTTRVDHTLHPDQWHSLRRLGGSVWRSLRGEIKWLRSFGDNLASMLSLVDQCEKGDEEYAMFMLHSSELMPGGSPYFSTEEAVENMYEDMERLFERAASTFKGCSIRDYTLAKMKEQE